jgi:hypothetical protein
MECVTEAEQKQITVYPEKEGSTIRTKQNKTTKVWWEKENLRMERKLTNKRDAANEEGKCPKLMRSTLAAARAAGHTLFE